MSEHRQEPKSLLPMIFAGLVMILAFGALALFLIAKGQSIPDSEEVRAEARLKTLADLNAANEKTLTGYHWIDKSKGIVGIPIQRAMELVLPELQSNKPRAAGPVNPPVAAPQPQESPAPAGNTPKGGSQ